MINPFKLVAVFFKAKGPLEEIIQEVKMITDIKAGWKTSEFWGKVVTQVLAVWGAVGGLLPSRWAGVIVVTAEGVYTIARTALKIYTGIKATASDQTTTVAVETKAS